MFLTLTLYFICCVFPSFIGHCISFKIVSWIRCFVFTSVYMCLCAEFSSMGFYILKSNIFWLMPQQWIRLCNLSLICCFFFQKSCAHLNCVKLCFFQRKISIGTWNNDFNWPKELLQFEYLFHFSKDFFLCRKLPKFFKFDNNKS